MITTVTLNASIDKLYLVDGVSTGDVMRVKEVHNTAGGKGLNVAKVAALAGENVSAMGYIGGFNGGYLRSLLDSYGIDDNFTEIKAETRSCINVRDLRTGKHTEFLEPGATITEDDSEAFFRQYEKAVEQSDILTISGSVPTGTPSGLYSRMITAAKNAGKPVLLDTSGQLLIDSVSALPTFIKPNKDEIAQLLGKEVNSREEIEEAATALHRSGIEYVVVSLGAQGALMVCKDGIFFAAPPDVPVVNTVGCGDSMVAGFAVGLARGYSAADTLAYASAVSTSNAQSMLTGHINPDDIEHLQAGVKITESRF